MLDMRPSDTERRPSSWKTLQHLLFLSCMVCFFSPSVTEAQEPIPLGDIFVVNSYTSGIHANPSAAIDDNGNFVVVWSSSRDYPNFISFDIEGQRFSSDGTPLGEPFVVNAYTTADQGRSSVAMAPGNDFIVVWTSRGSVGDDDSMESIQGQRFDSNGVQVGAQFQVNSWTPDRQFAPRIDVGPSGDFVVVWLSETSGGSDQDGYSVQGRLFASSGAPLGAQFQVNSLTTNRQGYPTVAVGAQGDFIVTWDNLRTGDFRTIEGQQFDSLGTPIGSQFLVNSYVTGYSLRPEIAIDGEDSFVVVWSSNESLGGDTNRNSVQARQFLSDGTPLADQFQANSYTTGSQTLPMVQYESSGAFVVVWRNISQPAFTFSGQRFDSTGVSVGEEFPVIKEPQVEGARAGMAMDAESNFVVIWDALAGGDLFRQEVRGQRVCGQSCVFFDGFESGDTSAWSQTSNGSSNP